MRKTLLGIPAFALAICAIPTEAAAISCPADITGFTRQYSLTADAPSTVSGCQFGDGNINGGTNDDFLDGNFDGSNGTISNAGFTSGTSSGSASGGSATAGGLTFNSDGTWTLTGAVSGTNYAIGLVDGADPKWAVFLVTAGLTGTISGTWAILKDPGGLDLTALSHIVLYTGTGGGSDGPGEGPLPEPASLLLFGMALTGAGLRLHRARR